MAADDTGEAGDAVAKQDDRRRGAQDNLRPYHALGYRAPRDGLLGGKVIEHTSDESIVYLVGKHVAIYSYEGASHRFLTKHTKTVEIITFAVSFNRRYIALSERVLDDDSGEVGVQVSVFNFNTASKVRTLSLSKIGKQPVEALDFSRDNKYLITVSAPPDAFIHFWQLDKARLLRYSELNKRVSQVSISPWAAWTCCATGTTTLRIWRYQQVEGGGGKELKSVEPVSSKKAGMIAHQKPEYRFTCHSWFDDDRVVVGTQEGDVLVVDSCELRRVIPNVFGTVGENACAVWALFSVGRGFVIGGDSGAFAVYERTYDPETYFQVYKIFHTPDKLRIIDISISPNEESLVCCYENNELALFSLANIDMMDPENADEVAQAFRTLPVGFHCDTITGFDVCIQKSIIVTTSVDKSVRIWNFMKKKLEIRKEFDEDALSISCHPTGMRILIGFKYKMCMYNVLIDNLHMCQEFPIKQCREVRFSHGGQYFAAVVVNRIFIFNAYTFEAIGHLTGHSSMVKSFNWMKNDQGIVSAGFEGAIYEWNTATCKRNESNEYVNKSIAFSAVRCDDTSQLVAAVGSHKVAEDGQVRKVQEGEVTLRVMKLNESQGQAPKAAIPLGVAATKHIHTRSHSSEVAISAHAQCLFAGTPTGQLQVWRWPMKPGYPEPDICMDLHQGEIWFIVLSVDDRYLFTVGEDHCMFMFDVDALLLEGRGNIARRAAFNYNIFDDVAFVLHQDIDDKARELQDVKTQFFDEQRTRKQEREQMESEHSDMMVRAEKDAQRKIEDNRLAKEHAEAERAETEKRVVLESRAIETQRMREVQELETLHAKKSNDQATKYEKLSEEKADLIVRYENKILKMQKDREEGERRYEQALATLKEQRDAQIQALEKSHVSALRDSEGVLHDTEAEHEEEREEELKKYQENLAEKEKVAQENLAEKEKYRRAFDKHETEKERMKQDLANKDAQLVNKDADIANLKKSIQTLKLEISVRNDTISASEKKILELKKQTAELEKLRYVLTFKFNELRKEVAPKDDNIKAMNERVQQMDEELERIGGDRDTMLQNIERKDEKIQVVMKEVQRLQRLLDDKQRLFQTLLRDLNELVSDTDSKQLAQELVKAIDKYTRKFTKESEPQDKAKAAEFERQRFYMEAQLSTLKKQNMRREGHMQQDGQRKTAENALLVREINDLRHEKKLLTQKLQLADSQLKESRTARPGAALTAPAAVTSPTAERPPKSRTPEPLLAANSLSASAPAPGESRARSPPRPRGAATLGRIHRGSTRSIRDLARMDPAKIAEIVQQVERNNADMARQQEEIQRLRDFVQHLLCRQQAEKDGAAAGAAAAAVPAPDPISVAASSAPSTAPRAWGTPEPGAGAPGAPGLPALAK